MLCVESMPYSAQIINRTFAVPYYFPVCFVVVIKGRRESEDRRAEEDLCPRDQRHRHGEHPAGVQQCPRHHHRQPAQRVRVLLTKNKKIHLYRKFVFDFIRVRNTNNQSLKCH